MNYTKNIFLLLILISVNITAQNFISNPGFEDGNVPTGHSQIDANCHDWFQPTSATPDIHDKDSQSSQCGISENWAGEQELMTGGGNRYAGIYSWFRFEHSLSSSVVVDSWK
jgi:hypothetical protein